MCFYTLNHIISSNIYKNSINKRFGSTFFKIENREPNKTSLVLFALIWFLFQTKLDKLIFSLICWFDHLF
jgi:hypothetical protein